MVNRYIYNLRILLALLKIIVRWKSLRFCQILCDLGLGNEDLYNEEPNITLNKINENKTFKVSR